MRVAGRGRHGGGRGDGSGGGTSTRLRGSGAVHARVPRGRPGPRLAAAAGAARPLAGGGGGGGGGRGRGRGARLRAEHGGRAARRLQVGCLQAGISAPVRGGCRWPRSVLERGRLLLLSPDAAAVPQERWKVLVHAFVSISRVNTES